MTARAEAARALARILRGGAWSNVVVGGARDDEGRHVAALVLDALRTHGLADVVLAGASGRPLARIQDEVLDLLRVAVGELDRAHTPPEIVTSATVDAARELGHGRAAGFVNGVLRSVVSSGLPDLAHAARLGVPEWLRASLRSAWGAEEAEAFWAASSQPARVGLFGPSPPAGPHSAVSGLDGAWVADRPDPALQVIDPASASVAVAVEARPGERVLDLAAAPGGKTAILAGAVGVGGLVVGADRHARRTKSAASRVGEAAWVRADGRRPPFGDATFDRVLLDAPCTGLGTLRRRPEILRRVQESEVERLSRLQGALLERASALVKPGGRVVYSVCTVLPAETIDQVGDSWQAPDTVDLGRCWGNGRLLGPHLGPTDGMFIAVLDT
ncbi:MAG: RsmB/NOP family class I SAM-dependent RNA methyltransferase [Acidimicrobiia bacterium]|jgi:16S rRNA (cytosine967-C5)-methyltransferase|nr:MAG: RsmB/NOP family class I SAM-dependent RNA methyltransferase [Acidimicrobiia bacterium]